MPSFLQDIPFISSQELFQNPKPLTYSSRAFLFMNSIWRPILLNFHLVALVLSAMASKAKCDQNLTFTDQDYELHVLLLSRSKLKSSLRTSTLMAGFALVRSLAFLCYTRQCNNSVEFLSGGVWDIDVYSALFLRLQWLKWKWARLHPQACWYHLPCTLHFLSSFIFFHLYLQHAYFQNWRLWVPTLTWAFQGNWLRGGTSSYAGFSPTLSVLSYFLWSWFLWLMWSSILVMSL